MKRASAFKKTIAALAILLLLCGAGAAFALRSGEINGVPIKIYIKKKSPKLFNLIRSYVLAYDIDAPGAAERMSLPLYELQISKGNMEHFKKLHDSLGLETRDVSPEYYVKNNTWKRAWLIYNGEKYRIKIKSHAKNPSNHRSWDNISFAIEIQDESEINKIRRFNLLVRTHIQPNKQIAFDLARRFGVIANEEKPVRVRINGGPDIIYYLDRRLTDEQMEADGRSSFRIFGFSESDAKASVKSSILPLEFYDEDLLQKKLNETLVELGYPDKHRNAIFDRYLAINRAVRDNNYETVDQFFDLDYIASFDAVRTIIRESGHGFYIANMFMFLDTAAGKFYPIVTRDEIATRYKPEPGFSVERQTNANAGHILALVSRNEKIRQEKYKKIYSFIRREGGTIKDEHRRAVEKYEGMSLLGIAQKTARKLGLYNTDIAAHNLDILKAYIEESKPSAKAALNGNRLTILINPNSMAALKFSGLRFSKCIADGKLHSVEIVAGSIVSGQPGDAKKIRGTAYCDEDGMSLLDLTTDMLFSTALDDKLKRAPREYSLDIYFLDGIPGGVSRDSLSMRMVNTATGKTTAAVKTEWPADPADIYSKTDALQVVPATDRFDDFLQNAGVENIAVSQKGEVVFSRGKYTINRDLVLPEGAPLVIEAGASLFLGENVLLSGSGGITVKGSATDPVIITSLDPKKPFGSVGILGSGKAVSDVNGLIMSNGHERWLNGAFFSGSLSIHYNKSVAIRNSLIMKGRSDDGMNIKYSDDVLLEGNQFVNNAADQVDLDYCKGLVKRNKFKKTQKNRDNGDGLDVSGSRIIAEENVFAGLGDKGVSVGEDSYILLLDNSFLMNAKGVAPKDLSETFFAGNRFDGNDIDIYAYQKKAIFGGARVYLMNEKRGSIPTIRTDNRSRVYHIREMKGLEKILEENNKKPDPAYLLDRLLELAGQQK